MPNYLFISDSNDGWLNLARDEYFLLHAQPEDLLLHLFVNRECVVISKYQNAWRECNVSLMDADGVKLVRRISGGGAVFHDMGNLNFSFIGQKRYHVDRQMEMICQAVSQLGVAAALSGRNDVTAAGKKFSGNAFCEIGSRCQHHGTLLVATDIEKMSTYLQVSEKKIRAKGVQSVPARVCNLRELCPGLTVDMARDALCDVFARSCGPWWSPELNADAQSEIDALYRKQASREWRLGRSPDCTFHLEDKFVWGELQLHFDVKQGRLQDVQVFTDALDTDLHRRLLNAWKNAEFSPTDLSRRLRQQEPADGCLSEIAAWIEKAVW